jgi:glycolate oxidase iron-sulfur subunit
LQTSFTLAQLADPDIAEANSVLRACVHCGFCTATCPTYVLLGDELDSPRGRIYLIKDMLENDRPASAEVATHVDRCLSCLACMTTCPSGVNYMHLVDHARRRIKETFRRPLLDRLTRAFLSCVMPSPGRFRIALAAARFVRLAAFLLPAKLRTAVDLAPARTPTAPSPPPGVFPAQGARRKRVALLTGCVQSVLAPEINAATVRLLTRLGCEVVVAPGAECCGSLNHHLGKETLAHRAAKAAIEAWSREAEAGGLDAIVVTTSGCGVTIRDYGFMFRADPAWADKAAKVSALARDVSEIVAELGLPPARAPEALALAYHPACSLQHGLKITQAPRRLLEACGFAVKVPADSHLCCGSAGTYNILQPDLASALARRKAVVIEALGADAIATGNIGCMVQLARATGLPAVHTVELLDWATGGPRPAALGASR